MKRKSIIIFAIIVLLCVMCTGLVACKHNHEWNIEWSNNETHHWHDCTKKKCKERNDYAEHSFELNFDNNYHWHECSVCGYEKDKVVHTYNSEDICTLCGNKHSHTIKYDDKNHWYDCSDICDISKEEVNHTFEKGKCAVCGFMKGSEGLIYSLNTDGYSYTVSGVERDIENMITEVVISEYYDGKPVTVIGDKAFYGKRALSKVYIPKTVATIKERAFYGCSALAEIYIPSSVKKIEEGVFENCYGITINAQAKEKPAGWITYDWKIDQFSRYPIVWNADNNNVADDGYIYFIDTNRGTVKYGIKGNEAIVAKQPITNDNIELRPAVEYDGKTYNVTSIMGYAFYRNDVITQIEIQRNTLTIGNYAFYACSNLTVVNWRENGKNEIDVDVEEIGACAFAECNLLDSFVIPDTVTSIGAAMLQGCDRISKIIIPDTVVKIGSDAFRYCLKLVIKCEAQAKPNDWKEDWNSSNRPVIWGYTDGGDGNNNITSDGRIILENEGVSIYLLNTQDRTAEVIFQENIMDSKIANIPSYTTYNSINYNMTKIGDNLFAGNSVLTKIVIPFTIKSIGVGAFANCLLLEEIEYSGTMEDWTNITKGSGWNSQTGDYIIKCSDGTINKSGEVI